MSEDVTDDRMSKIQSEVLAAHARMDAMSERIGGIETTIRDMADDVKSLLAREPSKLPIYVLGGILTVMLTILSLVVAPMYTDIGALQRETKLHMDGHPFRVDEKLKAVDKKHAEEHLEQEEDIGDLRKEDSSFEARIDNHSERLAVLETKFGRVVGLTSEGFHRKDWEQVSKPLYDRLDKLEMYHESVTRDRKWAE